METKQITVRMEKTKLTKNMVRYDACTSYASTMVPAHLKIIPNLYLSQVALQKTFGRIPEAISVVVLE